jgi:TetR/AcrR family transcriptional repressor of nem operon
MVAGMGRPRGFEQAEVLDRAMLLFWRKGFEAAGLVELEQATGLGRQSLYGAFGDKRALFASVVEHYFETVLKAGLIDVLDAPGSARANLERVFTQWGAVATAPDFNGCLIGNSVSEFSGQDEVMTELFRRKLMLVEKAFLRALRRAQKTGEVKAGLDLVATARSLVVISQGLAVVARVQRDPAFVRGVVRQARGLLDGG